MTNEQTYKTRPSQRKASSKYYYKKKERKKKKSSESQKKKMAEMSKYKSKTFVVLTLILATTFLGCKITDGYFEIKKLKMEESLKAAIFKNLCYDKN